MDINMLNTIFLFATQPASFAQRANHLNTLYVPTALPVPVNYALTSFTISMM